MKPTDGLRAPLAKARGTGAAKEGVHHWLAQRVTALALIPLSVWFVYSIVSLMLFEDAGEAEAWFFYEPYPTALMIAFLIAMFWHSKLGLQVVIEDYVHCACLKPALLVLNTLAHYAAGLMSLLAVLKLHMV